MTDARLRSLERAAGDDPAAASALITERLRAGGRDPRHDPRALDGVATPSGRTRYVLGTWPRMLRVDVEAHTVYAPTAASRAAAPRVVIPAGTLVRNVKAVGFGPVGSCEAEILNEVDHWEPVAFDRPAFDGGAPRLYATGERRNGLLSLLREDPGERTGTAAVCAVVWRISPVDVPDYADVAMRHNLLVGTSIAAWRRWAKRGRVLRVGP